MQLIKSPNDVSFKNTVVSGNMNKEISHQRRLSSKRKSMAQRANAHSVSAPRKVPNVENIVEGESEVKGSDTGVIGELDSSNLPKTSCVSSFVDEVSIEASFRQLQRVMEQFGQKGISYLNTYDARTICYSDPLIKANDTIKFDLETQKIIDFIKFMKTA